MPGGCSPPARAESWEGPGNRGWSSSEQEGSGRADTRAVHSWGLPRLHGLEIPVRTRVSDGEEEEERRGAGAGGEEPRAVWPRALRGKGGPGVREHMARGSRRWRKPALERNQSELG